MPENPIAVSTLGCPAWSLDDILRNFPAYGIEAVDFRGVAAELDVTTLPEFTTGLAETARRIAGAGLRVTGISSGINLAVVENRAKNVEEGRRTIPVARALGAACVRVFGGGPADTAARRDELAAHAAAHLDELARLDGGDGLYWLLETHDRWISIEHVRAILDRTTAPNVGVLWDIAHTLRHTQDTADALYAAFGARLRNIHLKDAVRDGDGWRDVSVGEGELPMAENVSALARLGYAGPWTLEHEKRWHPELAEPEVAFPAYVAWARALRP